MGYTISSEINFLIDDACIVLKSFKEWEESHIKRKANEAAHTLARTALFVRDKMIHIKDASQYINDIVIVEHCVQDYISQSVCKHATYVFSV